MNQTRRGKALLVVIIALFAVGAIIVVFLPPLLNAVGVSRSVVVGLVADKVTGQTAADRVHLTWFGPQTIEGLTVTKNGSEALDVNVVIFESLLPIVFSSYDDLRVDITGTVAGEVRRDGSISLADLFVRGEKTEEAMLAGVPGLAIEIADLKLILDMQEETAMRTLTFTDLDGRLLYVPGGEMSLALRSPTESGDLQGSLEVNAETHGLFDASGALTPSGATIEAAIDIKSIPVPFDERVQAVRTLHVVASGKDLSERLTIEALLDTVLAESSTPSQLDAALAIANPVGADGSFNFNPAAVTGEVTGQAVPSALLQPFLADSPIVLARDLGPTVDLSARFSAGETRDISVSLQAANLSLEGSAIVGEDRSIRGERLIMTAAVQPALVEAMTGRLSIDQPAPVTAELQSFSIPAPREDGGLPLGGLALMGTFAMTGPVQMTIIPAEQGGAEDTTAAGAEGGSAVDHVDHVDHGVGNPEKFVLADLHIEVEAESLAEGIRVAGAANVDEGRIEFAESISGLVDEKGAVALAGIAPVGQISVSGVNASRFVGLLPEGAAATAADALLGESLSSTVRTMREGADLRAEVAIDAQRLELDAGLLRREDGTLQVVSAVTAFTLTAELVSALQADSEKPVQLVSPADGTLTLEPITLAGRSFAEYQLPEDEPLRAKLVVPSLAIAHSALTEPASLRDFVSDFAVALSDEMVIEAAGSAQIRRSSEEQAVAQLSYDLQARQSRSQWIPTGTLVLENLAMREVERLADLPGDPITAWTGEQGTLRVTLSGDIDRREFVINSDLPNLSGDLRASLADGMILATADQLDVVLNAQALTKLLQKPDVEAESAGEPGTPPADRFVVAADVPVTITIAALSLPLALLSDEPFDPTAVRVDLTAAGGPLKLEEQAGGLTSLRDLALDVETSNLAESVRFTVKGNAERDGEEGGDISIEGKLLNVVSESSTLQLADATLDMEAEVAHAPTRLADALLGLDGLLVAAVGDEMNATFQSKAFSRSSGRVDLEINTPNGSMEGRLRGREQSLRTTKGEPLQGELRLTPPLRQRLLQSIHPLLADVRTTEHPIRFVFPTAARFPLDGDLSRLQGDLRITIGDVQFDSGSTLLALLSLIEEAEGRETIPGSIEPIIANIRKGIVTYEQFAVHIGKYTLKYDGQIDLTTKDVQLRTSIPLEALALTFEELEGYVEEITVPLVTVGKLGDLETKIDPQFNLAEAAAKAGFKGVLEKELEEKGIPLGDILGDLLRRGDKKKDDRKTSEEEEKPN